MEIAEKRFKRVDLIAVNGRVDANTAVLLQDSLKSHLEVGRFRLVLDLSEVSYISSAGLKVLLQTLKEARRFNRGDLRLVGLQPRIKETFNLTGLTPLFKIYEQAIDAVGSY